MTRLHFAIIGGGLLLYAGIHAGLIPGDGLVRYHGSDLIAGAVLLSLLALWPEPPAALARLLSTFGGKLALLLGASLSWEGMMPLISDRSTADWRDVLAYLAGGSIQHGLVRLVGHRRAFAAVS